MTDINSQEGRDTVNFLTSKGLRVGKDFGLYYKVDGTVWYWMRLPFGVINVSTVIPVEPDYIPETTNEDE